MTSFTRGRGSSSRGFSSRATGANNVSVNSGFGNAAATTTSSEPSAEKPTTSFGQGANKFGQGANNFGQGASFAQGGTSSFGQGGPSKFGQGSSSGFGAGGQRDSKCFNCGEGGHRRDECTNPPKSRGGGDMKCFNCGEDGHRRDECTKPQKPRGGDNKCFNCGEEGHQSKECTQPRKGGREMKCYNCDQTGHLGKDCQEPRKPRPDGSKEGEAERVKYIPQARPVNDIFDEDKMCKSLYEVVFQEDEQVSVEGIGPNVPVIDQWSDIDIDPTILKNIERAGYVHPRLIQAHTIPLIMEGRDVKGQAETGSGKSAAFLIPLIHKIIEDKKTIQITGVKNKPFAIIVEPTRELTLQVYEQARKLAHDTGVQVVKCYGQYDATANGREIYQGCDMVVATPGRLQHFVLEGNIEVQNVKYFVLDEADRLIEARDFMDIIKKVRGVSTFPKKEDVQTLLFSATFSDQVEALAKELLKDNSVFVHNKRKVAANAKITQNFIECPGNEKKSKVLELLQQDLKEAKEKDPNATQSRTLVFVQKRSEADLMALYLCESGFRATTINGDRQQKEREKALGEFRSKIAPILVATDVCARGLDIKDLDFVINMDLPSDVVTYVHRIGRTGRLKHGKSTSLFDAAVDSSLAGELVKILKDGGNTVPEFLTTAAASAPPPPAYGRNQAAKAPKLTASMFGFKPPTGGTSTGFPTARPGGFAATTASNAAQPPSTGAGAKPGTFGAGFAPKPSGDQQPTSAFGAMASGFGSAFSGGQQSGFGRFWRRQTWWC